MRPLIQQGISRANRPAQSGLSDSLWSVSSLANDTNPDFRNSMGLDQETKKEVVHSEDRIGTAKSMNMRTLRGR